MVGQHCAQHTLLIAFKMVFTQMLYRTSVYIRSDILGYSLAPGDLAYTEKLQMMEQIAESLQQGQVMRGTNSTSSVVSATSMERGDDHRLYLLREQPC